MERALFTGGAGFIGSHVTAALLQAGSRVRIVDDDSLQIHGGVPRGIDWLSADGTALQRGSVRRLVVAGQYRLGDIHHNRADITPLKELLVYRPRVGPAQGLQRFAAWVRAQPLPKARLEAANAELSSRGMMGAGSVS